MFRLLYVLPLVITVDSASAPFIKPCKKGDSTCVTTSAKAAFPAIIPGVPELGVKSLDPMKLPLIQSDENGLKVTFTDSTLTGLKGCSLENVKFDAVKMKQFIAVTCNLTLKGNYKLAGQLLILPVQGDGAYRIDLKDVLLKVTGDIDTRTGADGKEHWHVAKWKHNYQVKTNVHFDFKNLFNGNKALADPVLEFANSNWKEVMQEVAPPIVRSIVTEAINALNALYEAVPTNELYIK